MPTDQVLLNLAERAGQRLRAAHCRLATAESCTGGWIAKVMTDVPGSSGWFECGYVVYSNSAKMRDLGVAAQTLEINGAVSEATVREMAAGALRVSGTEVAVAVSGIAGPDGGTPDKPVGTVWFAAAWLRDGAVELVSKVELFPGNREAVRRLTVERALEILLGLGL
jgi:nicotinamide-nucleotide amidase